MGKMKVLDLFSGIGGFSLGLERTGGFETKAFVEIDPYCRRVLAKHWPDVPVYGDIRELTGAQVLADARCDDSERDGRTLERASREDTRNSAQNGGSRRENGGSRSAHEIGHSRSIDLICGGFPCTDISVAGKGLGITGPQSGLWSEYARIIGEVRPRYVIVENVAALLIRGMGRVLGDLSALGYDAEWSVISAADVGAPHLRRRIWIVANAARDVRSECEASGAERQRTRPSSQSVVVADADGAGRREQWWGLPIRGELAAAQCGDWWLTEPAMGELVDGLSGGLVRFEGRVAKGIPNRVQKLRALGNAVVPQIPEIIGRAIMRVIG